MSKKGENILKNNISVISWNQSRCWTAYPKPWSRIFPNFSFFAVSKGFLSQPAFVSAALKCVYFLSLFFM